MSARVVPSPEIWSRDDFPLLCMWRNLRRICEVGVDRAEFARLFLSRNWMIDEYWGVDAYQPYGEMDFDRYPDFLMAIERLAPFGSRAKLLRHGSIEASGKFAAGSLDFVYIDGAHDYESVRADIEAWWPKLAPGGVLAGHDFDDQPIHEGVKRAVVEFAERVDRTVYLTAVEGYGQEVCPSWYIYVNGTPGADWRRC